VCVRACVCVCVCLCVCDPPRAAKRLQKLFAEAARKAAKVSELREKWEASRAAECTFKPHVSPSHAHGHTS
jgi:hypothetical protein